MKRESPEYVKRHVKEKLFKKRKAPVVGCASKAWTLWSWNERWRVLTEWAGAGDHLAAYFVDKEWFTLSKWVRTSIKRFFRTNLPETHPLYFLKNQEAN